MAVDPNALSGTYYLAHFEALLGAVKGRYGDLFSEQENRCLDDFAALPLDGRALYTRFLSRRGQCFREDKLAYPELDLPLATAALKEAGFITPMAPEQALLLPLLTKAEIAALFNLDKRLARPAMVEAALKLPYRAPPFALWQMQHQTLMRRCLLLYFGNAYQDLSEFVITALEHVRYEPYPLDSQSRYYQSRAHLERHFALSELAQTLDACPDHALVALAEGWPAGDDNRWQRLTLQLARRLERSANLPLALAFYQRLTLPPARERKVRLIAKTADQVAAWQALAPILKAPQDASEQDFIDVFAKRLASKLGHSLPQLPVSSVSEQQRSLPQGSERVEQKALGYFDAGMHSENQLLTGLFGLLFWDIVFSPVPGAFFHPFQRGPKDLFSQGFYEKRQGLIEARLKEIEQGWQERAKATLAAKAGIANDLVYWPLWRAEHLALAGHIPGRHLALWFRHFLKDPRHHRSGFPDLLVVNGGHYQLVEVKGPGDRLQPGQKRWLRFLARHHLPVSVLHLK
ncbi:MAG: VRR-NUC domain-containing protein [Pseudomonadota bacterium]|uniref:VRR-NUC domain-containing protein n=1 Tax=Gallaecimonas pentaromativorans TaxID=584787 RepID=UPI00067EBF78|nr:VRR-NUC domain-containing protein [Gallaecimonas pentaromativorans]MED5526423.1 VRR-NUC domain-containing protein [Pseudomonadota bacterium]